MVSAIIMASGLSRRMQGINKLLLPLPDGQALIEKTIFALREVQSVGEILLITGHEGVAEIGAEHGLRVVDNPHPEHGICESIRLGAEHASGDWLMYLTGDQPFLDADTIETLIRAAKPGGIMRACSGGVPGSPVLFDKKFRGELMALSGDTGGKEVIERHPEALIEVEIKRRAALQDIDTPEAYRALFGR